MPADIIDASKEGRIYPKPFTSGFNVDLYNTSAANRISTEVYDMSGRLIQRREFSNVSPGNNTLKVNESAGMHPGVYIVMVRVNGQIVQSSKLVKIKK